MFLKSLIIQNEDQIIRDIPFHKGINLIVDETPSENKTASGNSVGKTTVLRLIDYCLDGSGENIFVDPEFKTKNHKIEDFLKENNIIITLNLIEDINDEYSRKIEIRRNFLKYGEKIQTINGEPYKNSDFSQELKRLIFKTESSHPTFKQLKSKNIRDEKNKLVNTLRVLAPNVVTDAVYEALHLFWFGIDVDLSKDQLVRDKNLEEKIQTRLRKDNNLPQIKQSLIIINKRIKDLDEAKNKFNVNEDYENELAQLNSIIENLNKLSSELSRLELRKELINESKANLEKDFANIDSSQIANMYKKAKVLVPNIQKTFEETLNFYNGMIEKKKIFITEELPALNIEIQNKKKQLHKLLNEEKHLKEKIKKSSAIEELQSIIEELNSFYEKKGNLEEQKRIWENSTKNLVKIQEQLTVINDDINSKDELIQKKIQEFNVFFSDISSRLDGVYSLLSADNPDGVYKFTIGNIEGNPGTGGKKSQMASFDLAYIKFADEYEISCLHFILQDQIENVHSNQITNLLTEIVGEVNCQYVLPVLRDKLPLDIDINSFEILSLSEKEKLFKIS